MKRRAFTLIELLVVIAILGLLAALLFPVFAHVRENGRRTACLSNERQLGMAVMQYVADNGEQFPSEGGALARPGDSWVSQCYPYLKTSPNFKCPDDSTAAYDSGAGIYIPDSYGLSSDVLEQAHGGPTTLLGEVAAPAKTVMLFEVVNDATATMSLAPSGINGSASGNGGDDCSGLGPSDALTFPCGTGFSINPPDPDPRYATGNIGGRLLNGSRGSIARHGAGANYVACDGHAVWLRPEQVSGGHNQPVTGSRCGQDDTSPGCGQGIRAAGTANTKYALTFSIH